MQCFFKLNFDFLIKKYRFTFLKFRSNKNNFCSVWKRKGNSLKWVKNVNRCIEKVGFLC